MSAVPEVSPAEVSVNAIVPFKVTIKPSVTVTVPAGDYILGDPCYTVPDEAWDELLASCGGDGFFDDDRPVGCVPGHQVLAFCTAYGDGIYKGNDRHEYAVDAGLIGLVPVSMTGIKESTEFSTWPPRRVKFLAPTECWNDNGILHFGRIAINTR